MLSQFESIDQLCLATSETYSAQLCERIVEPVLAPAAVAQIDLDIDPAVASGVFVTTVTDVVGFFAFLGLAAIWLV